MTPKMKTVLFQKGRKGKREYHKTDRFLRYSKRKSVPYCINTLVRIRGLSEKTRKMSLSHPLLCQIPKRQKANPMTQKRKKYPLSTSRTRTIGRRPEI